MDTKLLNGGAPITANGTYVIPATPGDTLLVEVDGTPDGASSALKWRSTAGNDHPVKDAAGNAIGGDRGDWRRCRNLPAGRLGAGFPGADRDRRRCAGRSVKGLVGVNPLDRPAVVCHSSSRLLGAPD
jgi:hypothetical protein